MSDQTLPEFVQKRIEIWDRLKSEKDKQEAGEKKPIKVTLPDGSQKDGVAFETSPMDIAKGISAGLARAIIIAQVDGKMWDLNRPLEGDCELKLLKFDDEGAKDVFWHSSAHILGQALELKYQGHLCIGPPLENGGFYYDIAVEGSINEDDFSDLQKLVQKIVKANQPFERMVLTKQEALELFKDNKYKQEIISDKIGDDDITTAYRCGPLIDLCRGPHVPSTKKVEAFKVLKASAAYWLGDAKNDTLRRVYGISFPQKKLLRAWEEWQRQAALRDHRVIGAAQKLFFFDPLSAGSAFWLPHGTRIYMKLLTFMRGEYIRRGFQEVVTPNIFLQDLWKTSGHADKYADNMYALKSGEEEAFSLKPMNCPGHCLLFKHEARSYRELPLRFADFGVLHRNEASGTLGGLTRVRRFQQDDAHIFCLRSQVRDEVAGAIDFMQHVYGLLQFDFDLELSTRPEKFLGDVAVWDDAEAALKDVLDAFGKKTNKEWKLNPGDGAFYGPKIDVHVRDALRRSFQCATIQLDFQLPLRFGLKFASEAGGEDTPVIIHRAIFGSVERFTGILMEHTGGRWPLWLSPRQVCIVPVAAAYNEYASSVQQRLIDAGFYCDVASSDKTMNKRVAESSKMQYNYILVVGEKEAASDSVNVRPRPKAGQKKVQLELKTLDAFIDAMRAEVDEKRLPADQDWFEPPAPASPASADSSASSSNASK